MTRETKDILKDLCAFNPKASKPVDRLPHDCYMILVGSLTSQKHIDMLKEINESYGVTSVKVDDNQAEYELLKSEDAESILEHVQLSGRTEQLEDQRKNHFVYEDSFNSSLVGMMESGSSFEKLKTVCRKYEKRDGVNVNKVMTEHEDRVNLTNSYFCKKNVPPNEAKALAFSISFYTGTKSEACNRGASLIARKSNGQAIEENTEDEMGEAAIILYYLVKALSYIPYYWGYVTRACELTFDELSIYVPGCLITWIQFSSSKKGKKAVDSEAFRDRNTLFKIFSLTGRPIKDFSNYPEEDEVLFLPHSTFLVFNRKTYYEERKQIIYMRQVELGLCEWSVLWVDDRIFDENWENKRHMEYAAVKALDMNVHFIPKSSTDSALAFLRSAFGQRLKNRDKFRIVTDMSRENEKPIHNAGARLIKAVRQMGFKNECMVFTSDQRKAEQILQSELNSREQQSITVSTKTDDLRNFVNFDQTPAGAQQSDYGHSSKSNTSQKSAYSNNDTNSYRPTTNTAGGYQGASGATYSGAHIDTNNQMMHNPENTDIKILIRNCKKQNLANSRHNCVLLTTGSFNPVHPLHFQNLLRVKQYLENEHEPPWNVLAGYISPTHDSYVHRKLGDPAWIPAKDRCRLCEGAIEYEGSEVSSWIGVSRGESEWADGFVDFDPVTENLRDFLNTTLVEQENILKYPLRIVYVCGLDHFNKCSDVERMAKKNNMSCAIVYRAGYDEQQIGRSVKKSGVIYIPLAKERNKLSDVSSTQIRQYFENPTASKSNIEQHIYSNVRNYMTKKYRKN